ncbi:MAG: aromatic-ring-hydroxylating dioxygenase subunit beta [Candidatus Binatia bacterium]
MESTGNHMHANGALARAVPVWGNGIEGQRNARFVPALDSDTLEVTERECRQIADFLYHEARLLDRAQWVEWLTLLTEEVRYRVIAATVRLLADEPDGDHEVMLFDEDKHTLRTRIVQWSIPASVDNPPPLTRHFITNIQVTRGEEAGQFAVCSSLLLSRSRSIQFPPDLFTAERQDVLVRDGGQLRLASRMVLLDQAVAGVRNLSVFF